MGKPMCSGCRSFARQVAQLEARVALKRTSKTPALYCYDDLSQLVSFQRGTLNGTKTGLTGSASRSQSWDVDAVGNFDSVTTDGTAQSRTANKQNEITSISSATTPTYDDNGNMTGDETGRQFVYDAWNRLVIVKNSVGTTLETFKYDGLNRRVSSDDGTTTTDLYYSSDWQTLSEKVAGNYTKRYVWSPVYIDALVLRDRDTDGNGTLDERLWVQQDANFNVTALVDGSGVVVERYAYDPYGVRTVYDASYTVRGAGTAYDFQHGFQGMWYDAISGLNFTDTRPYSQTLGRFTGPDWINFDGGNVNLYGFVGNRPVNRTDPNGFQLAIAPPPHPVLPIAPPPRRAITPLPIDWSKGKLVQKDVFLFPGTKTGEGDAFQVEIPGLDGKPSVITYFKPFEKTEGRFRYNCHGLTFANGKVSPEGDSVPAILKAFFKPISAATDKIQTGDIIVGYKQGAVEHSATVSQPVYDSKGNFDPASTLVDTKNGNADRQTMKLQEMVVLYRRQLKIIDWRFYRIK